MSLYTPSPPRPEDYHLDLPERFQIYTPAPASNNKRLRGLLVFASILVVIITPLQLGQLYHWGQNTKTQVLGASMAAVDSLQQSAVAAQQGEWALVQENLDQTKASFGAAHQKLDGIYQTIRLIPSSGGAVSQTKSAWHLTAAGEQITTAMSALSAAAGFFTQAAASSSDATLPTGLQTEGLHQLQQALAVSTDALGEALSHLTQVSRSDLPEHLQSDWSNYLSALRQLQSGAREAQVTVAFLEQFLGNERPQRYLVVFQNPTEIRASGGFIGAFALVELQEGHITKLEIPGGGAYDLQGQMKVRVASPEPLRLVSPIMQFHDANWYPDWPTSAQELEWYYLRSGGGSVDGVIAINLDVMPDLLDLTGPITLLNHNKTVTPENFYLEIQRAVEEEFDPELNQPKKILADLAPIILENIFSLQHEQYPQLALTLSHHLRAKNIQLFFHDPAQQQFVSTYDWDGSQDTTAQDYFMVNETNIAGGKTSQALQRNFSRHVVIAPDGQVEVTAKLQYAYPAGLEQTYKDQQNRTYVRLYVPQGSQVLASGGFEAAPTDLFDPVETTTIQRYSPAAMRHDDAAHLSEYTENHKAVFAGWQILNPGETNTMMVKYRLPFRLATQSRQAFDNIWEMLAFRWGWKKDQLTYYQLQWQKQSGVTADITQTVDYPTALTPTWASQSLSATQPSLIATSTLQFDHYFAVIFQK